MLKFKNKSETYMLDISHVLAIFIIIAELLKELDGYYIATAFSVLIFGVVMFYKNSSKLTRITSLVNILVIVIMESCLYIESSHIVRLTVLGIVLLKQISAIILKNKYGRVL